MFILVKWSDNISAESGKKSAIKITQTIFKCNKFYFLILVGCGFETQNNFLVKKSNILLLVFQFFYMAPYDLLLFVQLLLYSVNVLNVLPTK